MKINEIYFFLMFFLIYLNKTYDSFLVLCDKNYNIIQNQPIKSI